MICSSDFTLEEIADMAECIAVNVDPMDVDPSYDHIVQRCLEMFNQEEEDGDSTDS